MKFLVFIALFYIFFWYIFPFLLRVFFINKVFKMGGNPYEAFKQAKERQNQSNNQGNSAKPNQPKSGKKPLISDNEGDYIDFEEVK